ncbi:MAG: hypothetical protein PF436_05465 [Prolixibacteraceae bacterium]|nr:hypothetical protein [Prolixibacteraceae bacterium]
MKTIKEKKLEVAVLKEKLERISGKKILFSEIAIGEKDKAISLGRCNKMAEWVFGLNNEMEKLSDKNHEIFLNFIEDIFGENILVIIDRQFSGNKLHYHQNKKTTAIGGIDTGGFIENFEEIRITLNSKFKKLI